MAAEENGDEGEAERALLELFSQLPSATPTPGFAARVVDSVEAESRGRQRVHPLAIFGSLAGAVLLCWAGLLIYALMFGFDPTVRLTVGGVVEATVAGIEHLASAAAALVGVIGELTSWTGAVLSWLYEPELAAGALVALALACIALTALARLLPDGWEGSVDSGVPIGMNPG